MLAIQCVFQPAPNSPMLNSMQWFAAAYTGFIVAAYTCLLINGFVGFQFAEDGTPLSLWVRALTSLTPNAN